MSAQLPIHISGIDCDVFDHLYAHSIVRDADNSLAQSLASCPLGDLRSGVQIHGKMARDAEFNTAGPPLLVTTSRRFLERQH